MVKLFKIITHTNHKAFKKRQSGTEHETHPLHHLHNQPNNDDILLSRLFIVLTIFFWALYIISVVVKQLIEGPKSYQFTLEVYGYLIVFSFLIFSALMYLVARQGALQRFSNHVRVPRALIDRYFAENQPSITVLVPSYNEEPEVIRKTLLSAALQEYPNIKVVLLLDDDRTKIKPENLDKFNKTINISSDIQKLLSVPYKRFKKALEKFETEDNRDPKEIALHYMWAANWLNKHADIEELNDHVDIFFAEQVLRKLAKDFMLVSEALLKSHNEGAKLSKARLLQLHQRLVWVFGAEMSYFERKKYISLSRESNKAMNLNSYIGLMGGSYLEEKTEDGLILLPVTDSKHANLVIPDSEFLLTLDADSILLKDYCLRLVYFLQQPGNENVAVTQTPYSSFRGAPTRIERLSGATTDIQHILHQGMSYYNATFWVGANAVIRKKALEDIVEKEWVGGFEIKRYVQDRTVIEDTESSIDLALHGWRLVNYPERLSYSATPSDFGSLVIQRRRWANGGLIIMPKLFKQIHAFKNTKTPVSKIEFMLRLNYMASIAWSNFGLVFLLAYPYDGRLLSPFVLLAAIPYFVAMAMDLKYCRYKYTDIIRIYGFNLILLPVNLAGVIKSLQQLLTTKKIPFARTPKIKNRTAVALPYVLSPLLIVAFSIFTCYRNINEGVWGNAAFAGFNAFAAMWAILSYIGIKDLFTDLWLGIVDLLYVENKPKNSETKSPTNPELDWKAVLYHGEQTETKTHVYLNDPIYE